MLWSNDIYVEYALTKELFKLFMKKAETRRQRGKIETAYKKHLGMLQKEHPEVKDFLFTNRVTINPAYGSLTGKRELMAHKAYHRK